MGQVQPVVFVVDDDLTVRQSIAALARAAGFRPECYASGEDFLAALAPHRTGCLVLDLRLGGSAGLELLRRLRQVGSLLPVVVLSAYADVAKAVEAMRCGARTVLEKPCSPARLLKEIREAVEWDRRTRGLRQRRQVLLRRIQSLQPRERQVLAMVLEDCPNRVIARELGVSQRTVDRLRAGVYSKLGVQSALEAARLLGPWEADLGVPAGLEPPGGLPDPNLAVCRAIAPPHWPVPAG